MNTATAWLVKRLEYALLAPLLSPLVAHGACQDVQPVSQNASPRGNDLKNLSLEELGKIEVVTFSKAPSELKNTPTALYVITARTSCGPA